MPPTASVTRLAMATTFSPPTVTVTRLDTGLGQAWGGIHACPVWSGSGNPSVLFLPEDAHQSRLNEIVHRALV
jgi:hypothetical protein